MFNVACSRFISAKINALAAASVALIGGIGVESIQRSNHE
jgi:hypothetical protein